MESEIMLGKHNATQLAAALALGRAVPAACLVGVPLAICLNGSVSGWQVAALAAPVALTPGVEYIVTYRTANNYASTNRFFSPTNEVAFDGRDDDAFSDYCCLIASDTGLLALSHNGELLLIATDDVTPAIKGRLKLHQDRTQLYSHPAVAGDSIYLRIGKTLARLKLER